MAGLRIDTLTLFPGIFQGFTQESILKRAIDRGLIELRFVDWREHAVNRHGAVDDAPYGGGPGMVLRPEPVFDAVAAVDAAEPREGLRRIMLTPQGTPLTQAFLCELARAERIVLLCGRYEGFDERIRIGLGFEEVSIGDYVINGGEVAAMVLIEGVLRLLPGALGDSRAAAEDSFMCGGLEHPHYTRPPVFRGMTVPEVLLSGDHGKVARWRAEQAAARTRGRRSDLLAQLRATRDGGTQ
ncbi:MAG TPA: tRNA (guanosine(37)-N1)-methyltransferase TrmD [Planctomycetota bacterium]|nr:MAG: tRNA (guanine-N(1)-)-methyltransferase [Planctomycetes bacterium ADurb.Bin069]HNR98596.1 tRNA (guanosine(37)-N1)-methyltransferase TrmD [Planctomycetota bacterium]HNU26141.1 tRNA (guanosine(37)-N1)-methyltransferase TrmD [Planctomycetota bacterium]HOE28820.1 tRNA (guanosine(37)-N1)-methyltransferase TrmD [Planctomycetota bacterium]HOE85421.1 tRNA (guanosine(37)-N1)-methyltransferase TrmD [Planctomycetota bacterium]